MSELHDEFGKLEAYLNQNIRDELSDYMMTPKGKRPVNMKEVLSTLDKHLETRFSSKVSGS